MMHGREKSDSAIVAGKPMNKAVLTAAESVERRAGAKGNASQQSTHRTQSREHVSQALERVRRAARPASRRHTPKVGAVCPNWARTDLCGGREVTRVPTAIDIAISDLSSAIHGHYDVRPRPVCLSSSCARSAKHRHCSCRSRALASVDLATRDGRTGHQRLGISTGNEPARILLPEFSV